MTDLDRETTATAEAFARCIRNADPDMDADLLARELMMIARGRGWRPTEARAPWETHRGPVGGGLPGSEEIVEQVGETRRALEAIRARQHADRERLTAERPAGDVA